MNKSIRNKLSIMMFLEYVIWGAWLPLLGLYLGTFLHFTGFQTAWVFNAFALAAMIGMFFGGQLADRYFAQEKFLAVSHLLGAVTMFALVYQKTFWPFFTFMMLHCFFYVPTLSVTNAIAFANLKDAQKDFGFVRVWGTIGWIAAAWPFVFIPINWAEVPSLSQAGSFATWLGKALSTLKTGHAMELALTSTFIVSAIASLLLAIFSLSLPHTPPAPRQGEAFAPLEAIKLLAVPSIMVLFIVTFLDSLIHYCYFFWTSRYLADIGIPQNWIAPAMSIGQVAEILTMAALGFFLKRLGWRKTMIFGILGHVIRFFIYSFAAGKPQLIWLVIASQIVHGFAYAFFFASVYIYVDENFPKDVRTSAQGLFNLLIFGFGPFFGNFLWAWTGNLFTAGTSINFQKLFLIPMAFGIFSAAVLALFFHPPPKREVIPGTAPQPAA